MQLTIITEAFDRGTPGSPGPSAAAVLVRDDRTQMVMLQGGFFFGDTPGDIADCRALIRSIDLASQLGAQQLQLLHRSKTVVELVTGERMAVNAAIETLIDEAQMKLLQFDSWLIREAAKADLPAAGDLIHETITAGRDVVHAGGKPASSAKPAEAGDAPQQDDEKPGAQVKPAGEATEASGDIPADDAADDAPAWPSWDIRFVLPPGPECPAPASPELRYHFGPTVPADLCMYAACDVLNEGPIDSPRRYPQESTIECRRCGVLIHLQRRDERQT